MKDALGLMSALGSDGIDSASDSDTDMEPLPLMIEFVSFSRSCWSLALNRLDLVFVLLSTGFGAVAGAGLFEDEELAAVTAGVDFDEEYDGLLFSLFGVPDASEGVSVILNVFFLVSGAVFSGLFSSVDLAKRLLVLLTSSMMS